MKSCPTCGATATDDDAFCEADGAKLVRGEPGSPPSTASSGSPPTPRIDGEPVCNACGTKRPDDGDGYCRECGHRLVGGGRSTLPGTTPARVGDYTVTRGHGEGDMVVTHPSGITRLLVLGDAEAIRTEAKALRSGVTGAMFPKILAEGAIPKGGDYLVLDVDPDRTLPLDKAEIPLPGAFQVVRSLLDAAEELATLGFTWEPLPSDVHVTSAGALQLTRLRGARAIAAGEASNAKKVLEALGPALVPRPLARSTPGLIRLLLPKTNFSTSAIHTVTQARAETERAEELSKATASGDMAELCDAGLRRNHNEDATALAEGEIGGEPYKILVVCDGVSSSTHADEASATASKVARDALSHFARSGDILREGSGSAVGAAIQAAHIAICTSQIEYGAGAPPGTTIVVALIFRKNLTVGWVGDSRAYWISDHGAELCTTDHSWVNEAIARGEVKEADAMQSPLAHALTRCLGPLETENGTVQDVESDVRTKALPGPGKIVLCTDGLWNYFPEASAIAALVRGAGKDASPAAVARFLVCNALSQGGGDNVSVAVLDVR